MTPDEKEWQTRKERIDKRLKAQGWKLIHHTPSLKTATLDKTAVTEYPTQNGPADYALFVKGQLLGILEAKKVSLGAQNVLEQAKRYAKGATDGPGTWNEYHVPFLYSTNGEKIFYLDARRPENLSREIAHFHTPAALDERFHEDITHAITWLHTTPNEIERLRPYQKDAIAKTEEAIIQQQRKMLLAMATGTGKTYTTVALIHRLLASGMAKRILFLVDRRALAAQAVTAFNAFNTPSGLKFNQEYEVFSQRFRRDDFDDDTPFDPKVLPESYLTTPGAQHTFVYVATIQRMTINLFGWESAFPSEGGDPDDESDAGQLDIPIHAFDVIIADECHRGYTARDTAIWRNVLNHFDAIKIGLTATPAMHTVGYFNEPVYRYTTEQAINDGYLVSYGAIRISSGVLMNGAFLQQGEQVALIDTHTGTETIDLLEDERDFPTTEIERKITVPDTNRKIIQELATYAHKHEEKEGRFPKILIFAANDLPHTSHADQLVSLCREIFHRGDDFVQKITGSPTVDRPLKKIRQFRNRPEPKIVVTVDMLSTGVDIPALEFVVFLRPVKSRILWVQMLGRGTRLCPDINKDHFTIVDCFNGSLIEYFANTTDFLIETPQQESVTLHDVIENIYKNQDRDYYTKVLVKRLRRIEHAMSGEAREQFAAHIPDGDLHRFANELPTKLHNDFTTTMQLLRDDTFQDLLLNYKRPERTFLRANGHQDTVVSDIMIPFGSDFLKPEDYLDHFARFVTENPDHVQAIRILLDKPSDWKTSALNELRQALQRHRFPWEELEKAHRKVYKKALVDIISMVKHAARAEEPILTAQERVDNALTTITAGKTFTKEQEKWLELIRTHLITNLTIDETDLDAQPVFERAGGLGRAKKVFPKDLPTILAQLNAAVAA